MKRHLLVVLLILGSGLSGQAKESIWAPDNLVAWCIVPGDTKHRTPEERAAMMERLGFKHYAYDWRDVHVPTFDAEVEAVQKHGIEFTAWWFPTDAADPHAQIILDTVRRHHIRPQLWVMGGGDPVHTPEEQAARVEQEATRIRRLVELAKPYGCQVELYNFNGWFGQTDNELAVLRRLKEEGITQVGIIYNFSHAQADAADFAAVWKKVKSHVVEVNLAGLSLASPNQLDLGKGDLELGMMRVVQESGWHGPVGLIADREVDSEEALKNDLQVLAQFRQQLAK